MACSQNNNGLHAIPEPRTVFMVCQMKSINIVASALAPMGVNFQQRSQEVAVLSNYQFQTVASTVKLTPIKVTLKKEITRSAIQL